MKIKELDTSGIDELFDQAVNYFNVGYEDFVQETLPVFKKVIERDPNYTKNGDNAYYYLGVIYSRYLNEPDNAIKHLTKSIELDPSDGLSFKERGFCWKNKGDFNKALSDLKKAKSIDSEGMYPEINSIIQELEDKFTDL